MLAALQHIYSQAGLRDEILALVAADVNHASRDDCGRARLDDWQILVLAPVRLGCNFDYDRLQDLAEPHRLTPGSELQTTRDQTCNRAQQRTSSTADRPRSDYHATVHTHFRTGTNY